MDVAFRSVLNSETDCHKKRVQNSGELIKSYDACQIYGWLTGIKTFQVNTNSQLDFFQFYFKPSHICCS